MLDLKMLRNDPEPIRQALLKRMDNVDFGPVFELDKQRRDLISQVDANRSQRKAHAKQIGRLRATGGDWEALEKEATALKDQLAGLESALSEVDEALQRTLNEFPNYTDERIPAGGKENNQVVRTWGDKPELTEGALDHVELSKRLGLVDYERGTKLGGNGFWMYTGNGAALEWALLDYFCREHRADGYQFCLPPHLLVYECGYTSASARLLRTKFTHNCNVLFNSLYYKIYLRFLI